MTRLMCQEKQRISERIERLDAEREKMRAQLDELETAERVLKRFDGEAGTTSCPRARSFSTSFLPINPLPPMMTCFMAVLSVTVGSGDSRSRKPPWTWKTSTDFRN